MPKKPIEFTVAAPLVINIHKHNGVWNIHALASNGHHQKMKDRLKQKLNSSQELGEIIDDEYLDRKKNGSPAHPPFKTDNDHPPLIMREGEAVKFQCDPPFAFSIWADRDSNVDPNASAPSNPFGWPGAQFVPPGGTLTATVLMPPVDVNGEPTGPGPKSQGFYKFVAVVYEEEVGQAPRIVNVDPDAYCDR